MPSHKADLYIVKFYEGKELVEYKRVSQHTGNILQHKFYNSGRPSGKWVYYSDEGKLLSERDFSKLVYSECEKEDPGDEDFTLPQFEGGENDLMAYLSQKIIFPAESKNSGATGVVLIYFVVDASGAVTIKHICDNGIDGYCDLVVWEIVENMPRWTPGSKDGEPIVVGFNLPVKFT